MRVALDISSTITGWATWSEGAADPKWGLLRLPVVDERQEVLKLGKKGEALRQHLADLHALEPIKTIFYEAQYIGLQPNRNTLELLCGLAGVVSWFAYRIGAIPLKVEIADWKKHFFLEPSKGKREDHKKLSVRAAHARHWMVSRDDEADALGILDYGLHCVGVKPPWAERHLFGGRLST